MRGDGRGAHGVAQICGKAAADSTRRSIAPLGYSTQMGCRYNNSKGVARQGPLDEGEDPEACTRTGPSSV